MKASRIGIVAVILFGWLNYAAAQEQSAAPSTPAVPSLPAVPDPSARWEYRCVKHVTPFGPDVAEVEAGLNELGKQGWRLASTLLFGTGGYIQCFERPKAPRQFSASELRTVTHCRPACGSGMRCDSGQCVPLCQPACGNSQYCGGDGQCYWIREGRRTADPVASPAK